MLITLIGAGNLATQLGLALFEEGHLFQQVCSRTKESAETLAIQIDAEAVTDPGLIKPGADLYLCALKDDIIADVLSHVRIGDALVVHTAGSLPMDILSVCTSDYGVFYPLQTFSKQRNVKFRHVPIFVEAVNEKSQQILYTLASELTDTVRVLDSEKRYYLHLSAVFACNFVNHLYGMAGDILLEQGLEDNYLLPLIDETAMKVHSMSAREAQTGPALRSDKEVMDKHLRMLQPHPEWVKLYKELSEAICARDSVHSKLKTKR